jgi:hypothetical protein
MMPFAVPFRDLLSSPRSPAARAAALAGALSLPKERICCFYISGTTIADVLDARSGCTFCERERALTTPCATVARSAGDHHGAVGAVDAAPRRRRRRDGRRARHGGCARVTNRDLGSPSTVARVAAAARVHGEVGARSVRDSRGLQTHNKIVNGDDQRRLAMRSASRRL